MKKKIDRINDASLTSDGDGSLSIDTPELKSAESSSRRHNMRTVDGVPVLGHGDATRDDRKHEEWFENEWYVKETRRFDNMMEKRGYDWKADQPDADFWDSIL